MPFFVELGITEHALICSVGLFAYRCLWNCGMRNKTHIVIIFVMAGVVFNLITRGSLMHALLMLSWDLVCPAETLVIDADQSLQITFFSKPTFRRIIYFLPLIGIVYIKRIFLEVFFRISFSGDDQVDNINQPGAIHQQPDNDKPENNNQPDNSDQPDNSGKTKKSDQQDSSGRPENKGKPEKSDQLEKSNHPENNGQPHNNDQLDESDQLENNDRLDKSDQPENNDQLDKNDQPENNDQFDKSDQPESNHQPESSDQPDDKKQPKKGDDPLSPLVWVVLWAVFMADVVISVETNTNHDPQPCSFISVERAVCLYLIVSLCLLPLSWLFNPHIQAALWRCCRSKLRAANKQFAYDVLTEITSPDSEKPPLAGSQNIPLVEPLKLPLAGPQATSLARFQTTLLKLPLAGPQTPPLARSHTTPFARSQDPSVAGSETPPLAGSQTPPFAGSPTSRLAGSQTTALAGPWPHNQEGQALKAHRVCMTSTTDTSIYI
ncbi:hypothetical protein BaRGS_00020746 [Batillaria attramentaria]|uniref:Uncharacterized protein n=1 Tax=Batillaria attramentaria TaxID=370345 RepID=A0ABD0KM61_9CAEN